MNLIDPMVVIGMIFSLIVMAMIGGFILLLPVTRQLAKYLEARLDRGSAEITDERIGALLHAVESLRDEVEQIAHRQEFTERLLEKPRGDASGTAPAPEAGRAAAGIR